MNVTLGINNCFAVKRWPRPDEWAQIVGEELELEMVQHSLDLSNIDHDLDGQADAVRSACAQAGLTIHSVFTGLIAYSMNLMLAPSAAERARAVTYWSQAIRFASRLGATSVGGHVGSLSRPDADDPKRRDLLWTELGRHLVKLSELGRRFDMDALLVENMACDREPCRMPELASLMRAGDAEHATVALCLDVGHQCVPGSSGADADPYAWLRQMGRHAAVVHLQQSDAHGDHHWPFTAQYNAHGRIVPGAVLDALAASGADDVALVMEIIPSFEADDALVLSELRESVLYWRQALRDHGHA
ncbi:MAG TPA: sugar phosphate isomerase/epimerase [Solirubrobacteraceae bacterium]|jgi:sugar phosphate isomerase/epimerase|nr:sugar phosphate isomerase/epimerase [Solirubrobacteraceae bacterium]